MTDIIKVLGDIAELEHWTDYSGCGKHGVEPSSPPIIIWRHKHPSPILEEFFRGTIASFGGAEQWEFTATERNWGLMPARIREYTRDNNLPGELTAATELTTNDPEFSKRANAELRLLAEHIAKAAATVVLA